MSSQAAVGVKEKDEVSYCVFNRLRLDSAAAIPAILGVVHALFKNTPEWKPAEGRLVLDCFFRFVRRFVSLTVNQARIVTLWAIHTHAIGVFDCTPYLSINSAEKQSGKTRLLEILETVVSKPWLTGRVTAAVLIRKIDAVRPTLLLDESDAAFRGEKEYAEALRGVLKQWLPARREGVLLRGARCEHIVEGLRHFLCESDRRDRQTAGYDWRP